MTARRFSLWHRLLRSGMTVAMVTLLLFLGGCGGASSDQTDPLPSNVIQAQIQADAINIVSISNRVSRRDAVLLGVSQINAAGGVLGQRLHVIALIARDNQEAVTLVQQALSAHLGIIQLSNSGKSLAALPFIVGQDAFIISESATSPQLTSADITDQLFRLPPSDQFQGQLLAQLAFDHGARTAAVVFTKDDAFGSGILAQFDAKFSALGGTLQVAVAVPAAQSTGMGTYVDQTFAGQPDVILNTILLPAVAAEFVNESATKARPEVYLVPDNLAGSPEFLLNLNHPQQIDAALGTSGGFGYDGRIETQFFEQSFQNQFGLKVQSFNAQAYDFAFIAALAIEAAGLKNLTTQPTALMVRDSLRTIMNPPGLMVGPQNIGLALAALRAGQAVNYSGAYADTDWDAQGDIRGTAVYTIFRLDAARPAWVHSSHLLLNIP